MGHIRHHIVRTCSILLVIVVAATVVAGCGSSSKHNSNSPTLIVPKDPKPVTVVGGSATTLDLGGGADLIIPPGAMTPGATVRATFQGRPSGNWMNIAPTFAPVELISNPPNAIHGLLTLEFPVPVDKITPGVDPAVQFGISTYNPTSNTWIPFNSTYDAARHMVVAQIPHFSWWNPFTWDWGALARAIQQGFGQLWGERAAPPHCSGPVPSWVGAINFLTVQNDAPVRACAQTSGQWPNVLEVRMVNNQPYGQVLTYGSGVQWGWHSSSSIEGRARNAFMDLLMGPNQLYLPPLSSATVGILKPKPGTDVTFTIWPTWQTVGADIAFYVLGQVQNLPIEKGFNSVFKGGVGSCYAIGPETALTSVTVSSIHDYFKEIATCIENAFSFDVAAGIMDDVQVGQLESWYGAIKNAKELGEGLLVADVIWKVGDFVSNAFLRTMPRGNGFTVSAKAESQPTNGNNGPTGSNPTNGNSGPPVSNPKVTLAQGPVTSGGVYRYSVTLSGFQANVNVSVECYDSVSPSGFYNFGLSTDASGNAFTQSQCYSGDGPDHWVVANGVTSNHVQWGGTTSPPPPPPPPPPITYSETVGGDAHTWTNYSNAGGVQGATIPAYQTVQIACKVTGFRVLDGNAWWYRIASAPWSNAYYVSADAFYNNGATSGSLHGTPFVDSAVPDC